MSDDQSYWIKEDGQAKGPFSKKQLRELMNAGRATGDSLVSLSKKGPWNRLTDGPPKKVRQPRNRSPTCAFIDSWQIKRSLLGKSFRVEFCCPNCSKKLVSDEKEIHPKDRCPECGKVFSIPDRVLEEIQAQRTEDTRIAEEKRQEKQEKREERLRQYEDMWRREEKKRLANVGTVLEYSLRKTSRKGATSYRAEYRCPHCQKRLVSEEGEIGKKFECPGCRGVIAVADTQLAREKRKDVIDTALASTPSDSIATITVLKGSIPTGEWTAALADPHKTFMVAGDRIINLSDELVRLGKVEQTESTSVSLSNAVGGAVLGGRIAN